MQRPALVLSAAVPLKPQVQETKPRPGKKSKRTEEQRANRKARKAARMSKKRALRRAEADRSNAEHNPKKTKKAVEPKPVERNDDAVAESKPAPAPARPARRGGDGAPKMAHRSPRERSARSRIAIGVLLAVGLMLGFWLLFKLPAN